jgi:hypothetical protein
MHLDYGESQQKAFERLQLQMLGDYDEESLLCWDIEPYHDSHALVTLTVQDGANTPTSVEGV